jgi:hypothetical protein
VVGAVAILAVGGLVLGLMPATAAQPLAATPAEPPPPDTADAPAAIAPAAPPAPPAPAPARAAPLDPFNDPAPGREPARPPAHAAGCARFGTAVDFVDDPTEAARQALRDKKLLFVLHVAGNFEDAKFT